MFQLFDTFMNFFQFVSCLFTFDWVYDGVHLKKNYCQIFLNDSFQTNFQTKIIKSFVNIHFEGSLGMGGN